MWVLVSDLCIVLCIRRKQVGCCEASALTRRALRQQRHQQVCIEGGSLTGLFHNDQAPEQQWYRDSGTVSTQRQFEIRHRKATEEHKQRYWDSGRVSTQRKCEIRRRKGTEEHT